MEYNIDEMKSLREKNGYTLEFVAKSIGFSSRRSYHKVECGQKGMSVEKLKNLADLYNVSMEKLIMER